MGAVSFVAKRSMLRGRVVGESVTLDVDLQDAIRGRDIRSYPHRASSGALETLYVGADTRWQLTFEPVAGDMFSRLKEFLDSTAGGESFLVWAYGTEATPLTVRRIDRGYSPQPFLRTGRKASDPFVMQITVIES